MFPALRSACKSRGSLELAAQASRQMLRNAKAKIGRSLSAGPEAEHWDSRPYAAGFFAGALMFGAGRYISIINNPKETVCAFWKRKRNSKLGRTWFLLKRKKLLSRGQLITPHKSSETRR